MRDDLCRSLLLLQLAWINSGIQELQEAGSELSQLHGQRIEADYRMSRPAPDRYKHAKYCIIAARDHIETIERRLSHVNGKTPSPRSLTIEGGSALNFEASGPCVMARAGALPPHPRSLSLWRHRQAREARLSASGDVNRYLKSRLEDRARQEFRPERQPAAIRQRIGRSCSARSKPHHLSAAARSKLRGLGQEPTCLKPGGASTGELTFSARDVRWRRIDCAFRASAPGNPRSAFQAFHFDVVKAACHINVMSSELIFEVIEADEGGYSATALGIGITTQADTVEELRAMVREAVACYFENPEDRAPPDPPALRPRRSSYPMKMPRDLSGGDLVKALGVLGYAVSRQHGSHLRITTQQHGTHHEVVPNHRPIKIGTLQSILGTSPGITT